MNIEKIEIDNKGYNEKIKLKNHIEITDKDEIKKIISTLNRSKSIEDVTIGSNYGYIRTKLFNAEGNIATINNFYSVYDGVIIMYEDDEGIRRYRNNQFVQKIEELLYKGKGLEGILNDLNRE